ncbi:AcrR family transcriptional regulator [Conyzicola lurida]|uniref:AcrR family transcriptional regulator n=1 Tax=Conyzicola lurida TaxID=1172621 RepID=A0A841AQV6_9MICO|nr:AcrR family transcriptional regulator [Conyzicola lurida]
MTSAVIAPDRRAELKARHRLAIIDAADSLIRERGEARFSVDELAERADVSRRTVFNHFSSLDDVVMTTCARVLSDVIDEFRAESAATPAADGSRVTLFADITTVLRHIDLPTVIAYLCGVLGTGGDAHHAMNDIFIRATDQLTLEISGRASEIDDFEAAVLVSSLINGLAVTSAHWIAQTGAGLDDASRAVWAELLDRLIETIRRGY